MIISWGISGIHILIEVLRHSFKGTKTTVNISLSGEIETCVRMSFQHL